MVGKKLGFFKKLFQSSDKKKLEKLLEKAGIKWNIDNLSIFDIDDNIDKTILANNIDVDGLKFAESASKDDAISESRSYLYEHRVIFNSELIKWTQSMDDAHQDALSLAAINLDQANKNYAIAKYRRFQNLIESAGLGFNILDDDGYIDTKKMAGFIEHANAHLSSTENSNAVATMYEKQLDLFYELTKWAKAGSNNDLATESEIEKLIGENNNLYAVVVESRKKQNKEIQDLINANNVGINILDAQGEINLKAIDQCTMNEEGNIEVFEPIKQESAQENLTETAKLFDVQIKISSSRVKLLEILRKYNQEAILANSVGGTIKEQIKQIKELSDEVVKQSDKAFEEQKSTYLTKFKDAFKLVFKNDLNNEYTDSIAEKTVDILINQETNRLTEDAPRPSYLNPMEGRLTTAYEQYTNNIKHNKNDLDLKCEDPLEHVLRMSLYEGNDPTINKESGEKNSILTKKDIIKEVKDMLAQDKKAKKLDDQLHERVSGQIAGAVNLGLINELNKLLDEDGPPEPPSPKKRKQKGTQPNG